MGAGRMFRFAMGRRAGDGADSIAFNDTISVVLTGCSLESEFIRWRVVGGGCLTISLFLQGQHKHLDKYY